MTLNNESEELNVYRIEKFGISQMFEAFISSCWLGARKPIRRFYSRALGIAHAEPSTSLFIDDRQQNLTPATTLGMNVILFKSATQLRSDLERFLDLEIPGA
jgi:putative hydrolase of the HAD superfamily